MKLATDYICKHCGRHRGKGTDHSKCAAAQKKTHRHDARPRKYPLLSKKQIDFLSKTK